LIRRFRRFEDMILRFVTDLTVPITNNTAEQAIRPVKVQQRTSGGAWCTLQGLADFAIVQSYLDTPTKWGLNRLDALRKLFTTGAWLPPTLSPAGQLQSKLGGALLFVQYVRVPAPSPGEECGEMRLPLAL
jgi:transposase